MKQIFTIFIETIAKLVLVFLCCIVFTNSSEAQIENLIVETYYVADANDATDTTQGRSLQPGMKTYRIYLDLAPQTKLHRVFASSIHSLRITSTDYFYNNIDRPNAHFGHQINKNWFEDNPTIALDSWLTLGFASSMYSGVPKSDDTNGSFVGGMNNFGGTAAIPGGILINNDPLAGIPLTDADGYMPNLNTAGQWYIYGFEDTSGDDTTVFGPIITGNEFLSDSLVLQQNSGIYGADSIVNKVLVAQLTTSGDISFELNVQVEQFDGTNYNMVTYVANGDSLFPGEIVSPLLSYPPSCGCTDPNYLEYSNAYACEDPGMCQTLIVFGCMDTLACNYDPGVNFNLPALCCYPGLCNDRDLSVVCPSESLNRITIDQIFPSPAFNDLYVRCTAGIIGETTYSVVDITGKLLMKKYLDAAQSGNLNIKIDISDLDSGLYFLIVERGDFIDNTRFIKSNQNEH